MKTDIFQSCGNCCVFQICWNIECSTFTASSLRIWNSSTGIPSPPLSLFDYLWPPRTAAHHISLSFTNSQSLLKLMSIKAVMRSNNLVLCHPLLLLPSIFPNIRVFSNESVLHIRWPNYWGFSFNISPSNEHPGLISFRMDWLDLLAVQGTLKSLLQHHRSILRHSAFFIVQPSHPYITWKNHSLG